MTPSRLIIFDLDNTLIVSRTAAKDAYKHAINYIAKQHGLHDQRYKLYNNWKKLVQTLKHEKDPLKREFSFSLKKLLEVKKIPDTYLPQALKQFEKHLLEKLEVQNGVNEMFTWLNNKGYAIAVATESMKGAAKKKLKATGLWNQIDALVTSTDVGIMKPDPSYYQLILDKFNIKKQHVVVVGDRLVEDLEPAQRLGLKTILVPPEKFHLKIVKEALSKEK